MPQVTSPLSAPAGMPLVNAAHISKAAGLFMSYATLAEAHAACAAEGASWPDGQRLACAAEAEAGAIRVYRTSLGHVRTALVGARQFVLPGEANLVRTTSGAPATATGENGDVAADPATGKVYTKSGGAWTAVN